MDFKIYIYGLFLYIIHVLLIWNEFPTKSHLLAPLTDFPIF